MVLILVSAVSPLAIYTGDPKYWETIPDIIQMYTIIKQTGLPNYQYLHNLNLVGGVFTLKISGITRLNTIWLPPRTCQLQSTEIYHTLGQHLNLVESYIMEECAFNAMYGPFMEPPIELHVTPLMMRTK